MANKIYIPYQIRPLTETDRGQVLAFMQQYWAGETVVAHGTIFHPAALPGFVAEHEGNWAGLATYKIENSRCELVHINSIQPEKGIAAALLRHIIRRARDTGCTCLHVTTTNDNISALRFYQRHGLRITAIHRDAVAESRKLKPTIPLLGESEIPILDEIVLELNLENGR